MLTETIPAEDEPLDGPVLVGLLLRRWWLTMGLVILVAAAGVVYARRQPSKYTSSQELVVSGDAPNPVVLNVTSASLDPARLVQTQVDIFSGQVVKDAVDSRLGQNAATILVGSSSTSNLMSVSATAGSRKVSSEALGIALETYQAIAHEQQVEELGSVQSTLRKSLQSATLAYSDARTPQLRSLDQQRVSSLESTQDELDASEAAGKTTTQTIGGLHVDGPTTSPSAKEAGVVGAVLGLVIAAIVVVFTRSLGLRRRGPVEFQA
jgi:hypothetical protein